MPNTLSNILDDKDYSSSQTNGSGILNVNGPGANTSSYCRIVM
jgi:hypothetical protein